MVTPSYCSYTVLGKFTTKLRLQATSAIQSYVNVRQNGDSKRPPGWRGPQEEPKTITKKAPQGAIVSNFQGLAGGDPRQRPKQSGKELPGSHSEPFSESGWEGPQEETKTITKKVPRKPF